MAKELRSIDEIHEAIKRRIYSDECVPHVVRLDNQVKYAMLYFIVCNMQAAIA